MKLKVNIRNQTQARENASDQVAIGFSFASERVLILKGKQELNSRPITELSKGKPMQSRITFDTQLKITISFEENIPSGFTVDEITKCI